MDEYGWGLTSAGFRRPTYNELLDALEHKARELFGATANLSIGETLYHQRLPAVLYKVPGVLDFDVLIGTDAENLQADNIPVDSRSKVVTDDGMVTIDA